MSDLRGVLSQQIVDICQRLDRKGFVANHDGNVSVKFENNLLATCTAVAKASVTREMILTLDKNGNKLEGIGKPFSEIKLHLIAYSARADAKAVVHAHPPFATARGLVGLPLAPSLPEAVVSIGDVIPVVAFAMPGEPRNDTIIADVLGKCDVFMMPGNGVLAIGTDLEEAYLRLELVEHLAKIDFYAHGMGTPMELKQSDKENLLKKRAAIGLGPKAPPPEDPMRKVIAEEIRKVLAEL
jgi:L-fuculose-phosphate aldolase